MSKQIKQLTAFFRDIEEDKKAYSKIIRKLKAMERWLELNLPNNINGTYSFSSDLGDSCPRCFIRLNKDEDSTINLLKWLPQLKKNKFKIEKFWREEDGYFAYRISREYKDFTNYIFFFEESANIDGCVIKEKKITKKVFVTDCEMERIIL